MNVSTSKVFQDFRSKKNEEQFENSCLIGFDRGKYIQKKGINIQTDLYSKLGKIKKCIERLSGKKVRETARKKEL